MDDTLLFQKPIRLLSFDIVARPRTSVIQNIKLLRSSLRLVISPTIYLISHFLVTVVKSNK